MGKEDWATLDAGQSLVSFAVDTYATILNSRQCEAPYVLSFPSTIWTVMTSECLDDP